MFHGEQLDGVRTHLVRGFLRVFRAGAIRKTILRA